MPGMAADMCGVITAILLAGVLLFIGMGIMPTNSQLGVICLLIGIVVIILCLKSVI
jgi:membrane-bound ClpP family serine protease